MLKPKRNSNNLVMETGEGGGEGGGGEEGQKGEDAQKGGHWGGGGEVEVGEVRGEEVRL